MTDSTHNATSSFISSLFFGNIPNLGRSVVVVVDWLQFYTMCLFFYECEVCI